MKNRGSNKIALESERPIRNKEMFESQSRGELWVGNSIPGPDSVHVSQFERDGGSRKA